MEANNHLPEGVWLAEAVWRRWMPDRAPNPQCKWNRTEVPSTPAYSAANSPVRRQTPAASF